MRCFVVSGHRFRVTYDSCVLLVHLVAVLGYGCSVRIGTVIDVNTVNPLLVAVPPHRPRLLPVAAHLLLLPDQRQSPTPPPPSPRHQLQSAAAGISVYGLDNLTQLKFNGFGVHRPAYLLPTPKKGSVQHATPLPSSHTQLDVYNRNQPSLPTCREQERTVVTTLLGVVGVLALSPALSLLCMHLFVVGVPASQS